ncbi:MAG: hypothetical protein KDB79_03500, partial [Acidobacteria bacterium]|nr:hypothetical protein [Acidobacteriota bacterium]
LKMNEAEQSKKLQRYTMAKAFQIEELREVLGLYKPVKNSEAEFIASQMLLSGQIYQNNILAVKGELTGYDSNYEREENMKKLFSMEYKNALAADKTPPKVLIKAGHNHSIRGRNYTSLFSLGNFLSEFAKSNEKNSFHLAVYLNNSSGDYGVISSEKDFQALAAAAPNDKLVIFDFRPLRKYVYAGRVNGINEEMRRIIFGFDAALMIGGTSRGTYKFLGIQ